MTPGGALGDADGPGRADADLLRAHVEGDPHAFNELVRRHRDRLWAVALRTIGDREEAADAVQDALLSAHRAAARFRGDSAVTTWLHRIVVNACLDRIRRRQAHPTVPLPDGTHTEDGGAGTRAEPAAPAQDHDTALVVRAALAALPPEQRAALVLVDVQGYPVAEAAEILGVAEGTIKSRCARGRARMALSLGHLRTGDDGPGVAGTRITGTAGAGTAGGRTASAGTGSAGTGSAGTGSAGTGSAGTGGTGTGGGTARTGDDGHAAGERSLAGRRGGSDRQSVAGRAGDDRPAVSGGGDDRAGASGEGDGGHGGNPGGAGHVPSGSGGSVPLPAAGPIGASGDRKDQR